jgi:hypothetical protein
MLEAEENNTFIYERPANSLNNHTNKSDNEDDDFQDPENDYDSTDKKNDTISSLAKKIQETKLNTTPLVVEQLEKPQQNKPISVSAVATEKDDLDLDIDIDLENVDTTDVNLDDDLSD